MTAIGINRIPIWRSGARWKYQWLSIASWCHGAGCTLESKPMDIPIPNNSTAGDQRWSPVFLCLGAQRRPGSSSVRAARLINIYPRPSGPGRRRPTRPDLSRPDPTRPDAHKKRAPDVGARSSESNLIYVRILTRPRLP